MSFNENLDEFLSREALVRLPLSMVITNPHLPDNPIIYVNAAFEMCTGYTRDMAVGENCRFLQGEKTDEKARAAIRDTIEKRETATIDIYNYKADGTGFWNRLIIGPLFDDDGALRYYFGIQNDMSKIRDDNRVSRHADRVLREVQHRMKNHLSMISSMIRMEARRSGVDKGFADLANRVDALQTLYQEMSASGVSSIDSDTIMAGAYVSRIASAIGHLDGRDAIRLNIACDELPMMADEAGRLGLLASEFLTNAFKHAFENRDKGLVALELRRVGDDRVRLSVTDNGKGIREGSDWHNLGDDSAENRDIRAATSERLRSGARGGLGVDIARALVRTLRADVAVKTGETGTCFDVEFAYAKPESHESGSPGDIQPG